MRQDCLIAEIADDNIRYIVVKFDENSDHKILSKRFLKIMVLKKAKYLTFDLTAKKINEDIKNLEKELDNVFKNISLVINETEISCTNLSGFKILNGSKGREKRFRIYFK